MYGSVKGKENIGGDNMTEQTKKRKINLVNSYIMDRIQNIDKLLNREEDADNMLDTNYKGGLDAEIKNEGKKIDQIMGWLINDLNLNRPSILIDAEVDIINPKIRTA